jgi:hypothetical protein
MKKVISKEIVRFYISYWIALIYGLGIIIGSILASSKTNVLVSSLSIFSGLILIFVLHYNLLHFTK